MDLKGTTVIVRDGQFDKALRKFKKKVQQSGVLREARKKEHYVKPSLRKKEARNAARRRWLKKLAKDSNR